ncbi:ribosomal eL19 family protein [Sphingomonas abietis]|uniref:Uncharacterized protein n=1 Tax=Sphingomonas abietis TaxID=3012344 RepID=A0ABY7NJ75_9SPHN|nr:hypothetical protein [Sphingomonas abietis]WBO21378.1 hypothetical protein PBT88_14440 [Sphingomonas abietis]
MTSKGEHAVTFDDFIDKVHLDPARPEPRKLISGFVGRGATEDSIRVYSDPSLSQWVEASTADVLHSQPIADSPLGGSHLWLAGHAELKPGSVSVNAPPAVPLGGLGVDTGVFNPFTTIHPTIWTQLGTCSTHTLGFACTHVTCPPVNGTLATLCTHVGTCGAAPTHAPGCPNTVTCTPTHALGCPNTISCPPVHPNTAATLCTQVGICATAPTHGLGCPNTITCTPTHAIGCPGTVTCTPTHAVGCPNTVTCPPIHTLACGGTVAGAFPAAAAVVAPTVGFTCIPTLPPQCLPITLPHIC